jgi:hypothetical protein
VKETQNIKDMSFRILKGHTGRPDTKADRVVTKIKKGKATFWWGGANFAASDTGGIIAYEGYEPPDSLDALIPPTYLFSHFVDGIFSGDIDLECIKNLIPDAHQKGKKAMKKKEKATKKGKKATKPKHDSDDEEDDDEGEGETEDEDGKVTTKRKVTKEEKEAKSEKSKAFATLFNNVKNLKNMSIDENGIDVDCATDKEKSAAIVALYNAGLLASFSVDKAGLKRVYMKLAEETPDLRPEEQEVVKAIAPFDPSLSKEDRKKLQMVKTSSHDEDDTPGGNVGIHTPASARMYLSSESRLSTPIESHTRRWTNEKNTPNGQRDEEKKDDSVENNTDNGTQGDAAAGGEKDELITEEIEDEDKHTTRSTPKRKAKEQAKTSSEQKNKKAKKNA